MKIYRVIDKFGTTQGMYEQEEHAKNLVNTLKQMNKDNYYSIEEIEVIE